MTLYAPVDLAYVLSSAVLKMVTLGDRCDLYRSRGHFSLMK